MAGAVSHRRLAIAGDRCVDPPRLDIGRDVQLNTVGGAIEVVLPAHLAVGSGGLLIIARDTTRGRRATLIDAHLPTRLGHSSAIALVALDFNVHRGGAIHRSCYLAENTVELFPSGIYIISLVEAHAIGVFCITRHSSQHILIDESADAHKRDTGSFGLDFIGLQHRHLGCLQVADLRLALAHLVGHTVGEHNHSVIVLARFVHLGEGVLPVGTCMAADAGVLVNQAVRL